MKLKKKKIIKAAWTIVVFIMVISMVLFTIIPFFG